MTTTDPSPAPSRRPRRRRKLFILLGAIVVAVVGVVVWLAAGRESARERFEKTLARLQSEGVRTSARDLWVELPDEQNAAPLWARLFEPGASEDQSVRRPAQFPSGTVFTGQNWGLNIPESDKPALREYLRATSDTFAGLCELATKSGFSYPENRDRFLNDWVEPRMAGATRTLRIQLLLRGRLALEDGDLDQARVCCMVALRISRLPQEFTRFLHAMFGAVMLAQTVAFCHDITSGQVVPEDWARRMISLLDPEALKEKVIQGYDGERLVWLEFCRGLFQGKIRSREVIQAMGYGNLGGLLFSWGLRSDAALIQETWVDILRAARRPWWEAKPELARILKEIAQSRRYGKLSRALFGPTVIKLWEKLATVQAGMTVARLALAVKLYSQEHGAPPDSLSALVPEYLADIPLDPFTGNPFRYAVGPNNRSLISSAGPNATHDLPDPPDPAAWIAADPAPPLPLPGDDIFWFDAPRSPPNR